MTSDSKPSEGALNACRVLYDLGCGRRNGIMLLASDRPPKAIDREAVEPAVKPLVEALSRIAKSDSDSGMDSEAPAMWAFCREVASAALEPWRHLLDESGE